jgi:SAM-dependent methyltransferase
MPKTEPFESNTKYYDDWFERNRDVYEIELETVRQLMPDRFSSALEVGTGTGRFAGPLEIKTGVEPSTRMAELARKRGIHVCQGVAENLPFPDGSFDLLLMVTTICFVDDLPLSLEEAWRVLVPGGHILIGFVDRESELGREYRARRKESRFYREATFYSGDEIVESLHGAGFSNIESRQSIFPEEEKFRRVREGYGKGSFVVLRASK